MSEAEGLSQNERKRKAKDDYAEEIANDAVESAMNALPSLAKQSADEDISQGKKGRCWEERMSRTYKRAYWFDPESGESVWERPQESVSSSSSSSSSSCSPSSMVIEPLSFKHRDALLSIVSDPSVMSHIGKGVPWTAKDLDKQLSWSEKEWGEDRDRDDRGFYWAIMLDGSCSGLVGFYKYKPTDPYVLRVLLGRAAQGKGLGTRAVKEALRQIHTFRPSLVSVDGAAHDNNRGGAAVMLKAGFVETGIGFIGKIPVKNFRFYFD